MKKSALSFWRSRPLLIGLIAWFSVMWSWVFITDNLELAGGKIPGMLIATLVLVVNVSISSAVIWQSFNFLDRLRQKKSRARTLLVAVPVMALADLLISWLVAIVWMGPQGSIDNTLPMGSPALLLMSTPLRFASRILGLYGLAGAVWCLVWVLARDFKHKAMTSGILLGGLVLVSGLGWAIYGQPNGSDTSVVIVSETIEKRIGPLQAKADLVIFPEYGLDLVDNSNRQSRLQVTSSPQKKTYFVGSGQKFRVQSPVHQNILIVGNSTDGITNKSQKKRLIPGGEDLSYVARFLLRSTGQLRTLDYFSTQKSISKGADDLRPINLGDGRVLGLGLCSSIIAPHDYRRLSKEGATLLANSASLTIFEGSSIFAWQQKSLAKFNAVANARFFLQSANSATAYALDSSGKQYAEVKGLDSAAVIARNNFKKTWYTHAGEWLAVVGLVILIWRMLDQRLKR